MQGQPSVSVGGAIPTKLVSQSYPGRRSTCPHQQGAPEAATPSLVLGLPAGWEGKLEVTPAATGRGQASDWKAHPHLLSVCRLSPACRTQHPWEMMKNLTSVTLGSWPPPWDPDFYSGWFCSTSFSQSCLLLFFTRHCRSPRVWGHRCPCMLSCLVVPDSRQPHGLWPARLLCPWDSPGKNTGVGCHFILEGFFSTQGSNWHLLHFLHWQVGSFTTEPPGNTTLTETFIPGYIIRGCKAPSGKREAKGARKHICWRVGSGVEQEGRWQVAVGRGCCECTGWCA